MGAVANGMTGLEVHHHRHESFVLFVSAQGHLKVKDNVMAQRWAFDLARDFGEASVGQAHHLAGQLDQPTFVQSDIVDVRHSTGQSVAPFFGQGLYQRMSIAQASDLLGFGLKHGRWQRRIVKGQLKKRRHAPPASGFVG